MKAKRKPKFSKSDMKKIRALSSRYEVDMHEAARMFIRRGF